MVMLVQQLAEDAFIQNVISLLRKGEGSVSFHRPYSGGFGAFLALLQQQLNVPLLYVGLSEEKSRTFFADSALFDSKSRFFPMREPPPLSDTLGSGERMAILEELLGDSNVSLFTTLSALLNPTESPVDLKKESLTLKIQENVRPNDFVERLESWGYIRTHMVMGKNEFAIRGGIVDFFPSSSLYPYRIEWFDDVIDSIRSFELSSQRSIEKLHSLILFPPESVANQNALLLDYLPKNTLIVREAPEFWEDKVKENVESLSISENNFNRCLEWMHEHPTLDIVTVPNEKTLEWPFKAVSFFQHRFKDFMQSLHDEAARKEKIFIFTRQSSRLKEVLEESHLSQVTIIPSPLSQGFFLPEQRLRVYSDHELFGRVIASVVPRKMSASRPVSLEELNSGDTVVHAQHGIATFEGMVPISFEGKTQDYLALSFSGKDKLYVPLEEMEQVERYVGPRDKSPSLSKLGGQEWKNTKEKVKKVAKEIASDLVSLYAARSQIPGHSFSTDTPWQSELEEAFPYQETPDQQKAIDDAKKDMESPKAMDRLVLGDVGYGKTEVALRATFKAVMDGKQVAILVPTTVLAQQHYETFTERLETFPIEIGLLSRFKTKKEQSQILSRLQSGEMDVVIGTHRLIQKDVEFKKLGLLIVDEEQRFGVAHKEALKKLKQNVDVLTLSATPIPRTLYFSLVGVRDISVIETPPAERLPVKTFVVPKEEALIQRAITQELKREGQVYYLYNHVDRIVKRAKEIQALVPEARVAVAHGQMRGSQLEEVMWEFMKGLYDVLLCTTIIENGLDIPRVNTLIVEESHRYGLAQLYQLRGRVGRSERQAYAYFFIPPHGKISELAEKRLETIDQYSQLGSGYQIAMKDLEIRGAGNVLGMAQHGHVSDVGFHLYCKILGEEIKTLKGEKLPPPQPQIQLNLPVAAFIPDEYVPNRSQKLDLYRRLSTAKKSKEVDDILDELLDRFGDPPESVLNLLEMVKLRQACLESHVYEMKMQEGEITLSYWDGRPSRTLAIKEGFKGKESFVALHTLLK